MNKLMERMERVCKTTVTIMILKLMIQDFRLLSKHQVMEVKKMTTTAKMKGCATERSKNLWELRL
jgi:hypothetical protein